jgi:hypothetical protein
MTDQQEKIYVKIPMFDGDRTQWHPFKAKMQSYLARNQMGALRRWSQAIPKDAEDLTDQTGQVKKDKLELRQMNEKATAILLGSIETESKTGAVAFSIVKKTMKANDGCVSGDFNKAWKTMT